MNQLSLPNEKMHKHGQQSGFTLIEVLVASAIIMASIGVLMQLFASGLDRTQRAGQLAHLLTAQRTIVHELAMINPAVQKRGEGQAEGIDYQWVANDAALKPLYDPDGGFNRQIGLFKIEVNMQHKRGKSRAFTFELIGWKAVQ